MATSNFHSINKHGIFVVEIEEGDYLDDLPQDYRELFKSLQKEMGYEFFEATRRDKVHSELRSYPAVAIGTLALPSGSKVWGRKDGETASEAMVSAQVVMRSGYYAQQNLDWEFTTQSYHYEYGGYDMGSKPGNYVGDGQSPKVNQELRWMQSFIEREESKLGDKLNDICSRLSEKYKVAARYSNGETMYSKP